MIHAAVETCRPGDILVVTTTSPSTDGMIGELLATSLRAHGVIGVVIDAGVRDVGRTARDGVPRLGARCQSAWDGQGQSGLGQRTRGLRRADRPRPATRSWPTMTAWSSCPGAGPPRCSRPGGSGRRTRTPSGRNWRPGSSESTCTGCGRRWPNLGVIYVDRLIHEQEGHPGDGAARRHLEGRVFPCRGSSGKHRPSATTCCSP